MKKWISLCMALLFVFLFTMNTFATEKEVVERSDRLQLNNPPEVSAKSAVLMEANTGVVLYEKNASEALAPASVTKIMTLLLVAEAIEGGRISLEDNVQISANAASMGGSQVFLKEGEAMSVDELLKCTVIASANDASVALAEHMAGSEDAFVRLMNERARELSLNGSVFENTTGLDDTVINHTMSAMDIAVLSSMLVKYDFITKYSSLWQDSIRDGTFTLTNTNRLVRYYEGCNGLKTGSTDKAGYCVSVSAQRKDINLICVIMGAQTKEIRNEEARALLDFGFSSVELYSSPTLLLEQIPVLKSSKESIWLKEEAFSFLCLKGSKNSIEKVYEIPDTITAPIEEGSVIGKVEYYLNGEPIGTANIVANESARVMNYLEMIKLIFTTIFHEKNSQ